MPVRGRCGKDPARTEGRVIGAWKHLWARSAEAARTWTGCSPPRTRTPRPWMTPGPVCQGSREHARPSTTRLFAPHLVAWPPRSRSAGHSAHGRRFRRPRPVCRWAPPVLPSVTIGADLAFITMCSVTGRADRLLAEEPGTVGCTRRGWETSAPSHSRPICGQASNRRRAGSYDAGGQPSARDTRQGRRPSCQCSLS